MNEGDLLQILARGEGSRHQFKHDETNAGRITAELAAFANSGGAWVVGQKVSAGVERDKKLGNPEYGRVRAATFASSVDTANARLLKLRGVLATRYEGIATDQLLGGVLTQPVKAGLAFSGNGSENKSGAADG